MRVDAEEREQEEKLSADVVWEVGHIRGGAGKRESMFEFALAVGLGDLHLRAD